MAQSELSSAPGADRRIRHEARDGLAAGIDGEAVRDVRVLERFSLLAVPADEAERISAALKDRRLNVEPARN